MAEPVTEPVTEPAEARGGQEPDWEAVRPGEPLRPRPEPEKQGGDRERA